jgi:hypothetical protein
MTLTKDIQRGVEDLLRVFDNPIVYTLFVTFVAVYSYAIVPQASIGGLKVLFDNVLFKIAFFFVVILFAYKDPRIALILSIVFVLTMQYLQFADVPASRGPKVIPAGTKSSLGPAAPIELDLDKDFPTTVSEDGTAYEITKETEAGLPLHPDLIHSGPQAMGEPIQGWDDVSDAAPF